MSDYARGFHAGRDSVLRHNESGCCCKIDEDGETLLSPCAMHKAWIAGLERELEAAREVITWLVDGVPRYPLSFELRGALDRYDRVVAEIKEERE